MWKKYADRVLNLEREREREQEKKRERERETERRKIYDFCMLEQS